MIRLYDLTQSLLGVYDAIATELSREERETLLLKLHGGLNERMKALESLSSTKCKHCGVDIILRDSRRDVWGHKHGGILCAPGNPDNWNRATRATAATSDEAAVETASTGEPAAPKESTP